MIRLAAAFVMLSLVACAAQTGPGYGAGTVWELTHIDGTPFPARATLSVDDTGRVSGTAPCNGYSGGGGATYPAFEARRVRSTKRACPDLRAETAFFQALAAMQEASRTGETLTLRGAGRTMTFTASE